jgi:hypothetical protein
MLGRKPAVGHGRVASRLGPFNHPSPDYVGLWHTLFMTAPALVRLDRADEYLWQHAVGSPPAFAHHWILWRQCRVLWLPGTDIPGGITR